MVTLQEKIELARRWQQQQMSNCGCGTPFYAIVIIAIVMLLSSCATKTKIEYRDRDVNHYITNVVHDTLIDKVMDSVHYEVLVKGDTVYKTKYKERIQWRDRIVERHDTCWRDSIVNVNKEIVKEVTKIPKLYHFAMGFSVFCLVLAILKLLKWLKTR